MNLKISEESKAVLKKRMLELDTEIEQLDDQISPVQERLDLAMTQLGELNRQRALLVDTKKKLQQDAEE